MTPPESSQAVRQRLVDALNLDLVGPWAGHALADEKLPGWVRPSNWYLTGFLVPSDAPVEQRSDADEDEEIDEVPDRPGLLEESVEERKAAKRSFFPSSMGLSFLVSKDAEELAVTVRWGDYAREQRKSEEDEKGDPPTWRRRAEERALSVNLSQPGDYRLPDSGGGLVLHVVERAIKTANLPGVSAGTRSVSIFLVNRRVPDDNDRDLAYAFQAGIEVRSDLGFVPRPDPRNAQADDWDASVADLHYSDSPEYATGHGVSADWEVADGVCKVLRTTWIPRGEVAATETVPIEHVELSMMALGQLGSGQAATGALAPLVEGYRRWIREQRENVEHLEGPRRETAEELLRRAGYAAGRIERGIAVLAENPEALDAFRVANRAVGRALQQRTNEAAPEWRAFQLAFILLNVAGLADPEHAERKIADLLFFPTGGGKTEAYLGLAAFAMVLRRLQHPEAGGRQGAGVSVIMRYTLRLLTLDQLSRAAGLICALELEREQDPGRYGQWPFEIGLWVGKAATPNHMGRKGDQRSDTARTKTNRFKANPRSKPAPIPLQNCPWCGTRFTADSFTLEPDADTPEHLRIACSDFQCDFSGGRALPIVAVDEPLYRRLPAFLIATVDKFASLPWVGETGMLLGGAERWDDKGFYGATRPQTGRPLGRPLPPPDLVIQDELHLISGPLGTMVGLYESSISALCLRGAAEGVVGPKIVASTATARRSDDQIQALFARPVTQVFPPPGPERGDSFFARTRPLDDGGGRMYLGIVSPGRNPKVLMRRTWLALMGAAQKAYREAGGNKNKQNPADPYMTVLGYFNSLRELGGARRILEEEVQNTVRRYRDRKRVGEKEGLFASRQASWEVIELTSREPADKVAEARRRLGSPFHEIKQRVDSAIATNMISVGLDILRLGLMVVLGQPKTAAEYIQATSRVGRDVARPGLVVTLLNMNKPRDRSHYERFRHYHDTFYRSVEVSSVTPFSARALDRGFAGALVGLARHAEGKLTPPRGVERVGEMRTMLERWLLNAFLARVDAQPLADEDERAERRRSVQNRVVDLLDAWNAVVDDYHGANVTVAYQRHELRTAKPLLREMLATDFESPQHRKFRANRSLRDVEPEVGLRLRTLTGGDVEDE